MATMLAMVCIRYDRKDMIPLGIVLGFALDFCLMVLFLR
jgi:hypothetical protein